MVVMTAIAEQRRPVIGCIADAARDQAVARVAATLARHLQARLLLATVEQPTPEDAPRTAASADREPLLASAARGLEPAAELHVARGEPAERLLAVADRELAQLVVVAVPPRSSPHALGNVHLALASAAPCPVVVVPADLPALPADGPIVCGVDGTPSSQAAVRVAGALAERLGARLLCVHADELPAAAERMGAQLVVVPPTLHRLRMERRS
jgi:nucleotide-binding universal stress UspA family protein